MAGNAPTNRLNVDVYYESLCPDSIRWIKQQLLPQYDILKDYISVSFIPYGKATVSCVFALKLPLSYLL